jgi:acetyl-CoA acetyltransferase
MSASAAPKGFEGVAVCVPVTYGYAKSSSHGAQWFVGGALRELVRRSGVPKDAIDGLVLASYRLAPDNAASLTEYLGISPRFLVDLPYGGASGVVALRRAARAVQSGDAQIVACIGADVPPRDASFMANFSSFARDFVHPYGAGGANAVFALITQSYMQRTGATREDFGRVCIAQRANGANFPGALLTQPLSMSEYLGARPIAEPLHLYDCVLRSCGAEGFLVMSTDRARALGLPWARVAATVERHNGAPADSVQETTLTPEDSRALWQQAGLGPADMRFVQAYDDYPVVVLMQLESLGFCGKGEGPRLVRERRLTTDGDLPLNTGGGMLALGQAGAAGGFLGLTEGIRQVAGQALGAAVKDARAGVISGYGTVNYDRGLCTGAVVLAREDVR